MSTFTRRSLSRLGWLAVGVPSLVALVGCATGFEKTDKLGGARGGSGGGTGSCDPTVTDCSTQDAEEGATAGGSGTTKDAGHTTPVTHPDGGTTGGSDGGGTTAPDGGSTIGTGECGSKATKDTCYDCCNSKHSTGAKVYSDAFLTCACQTQATCAQQCANEVCGGAQVTQGGACDNCLAVASNGSCGGMADTACNSSTECVAWSSCFIAAKCDSKP